MRNVIIDALELLWGARIPESEDTRRRRLEEGTVLASVRVAAGAVPGLTGEWRRDRWRVEPALLACGTVELAVGSVAPATRLPDANDRVTVGSRHVVLMLRVGDAVVELAVRDDAEGAVRSALAA